MMFSQIVLIPACIATQCGAKKDQLVLSFCCSTLCVHALVWCLHNEQAAKP